jgi:hypothetical protein
MAFGQQAGPPATAKQVAYLLSLLNADGYDFATGRHHYGLTQRQARGKFTRAEASELIDRLVAKAEGTEPSLDVTADDPKVTEARARLDSKRATLIRGIPAELLADELERRGWAVIPPS